MALYRLTFSRSAEKEMERVDREVAPRIAKAIDGLAANPRPHGCKKLKNYAGLWRIRVGNYRIIYAIDDTIRVVAIERIAHRKDAYD